MLCKKHADYRQVVLWNYITAREERRVNNRTQERITQTIDEEEKTVMRERNRE